MQDHGNWWCCAFALQVRSCDFLIDNMEYKFSRLVVLSLSLVLTGCAATGPNFTPYAIKEADKGLLYVYRPVRWENSAISPGVIIDGNEYAVLPHGGYMPFALSPGWHSIELKFSDRFEGQAKISVEIGLERPVFIRVETWNDISDDGVGKKMTRTFRLAEQSAAGAALELSDSKLQDAVGGARFSKSYFFSNN